METKPTMEDISSNEKATKMANIATIDKKHAGIPLDDDGDDPVYTAI